MALLKKPNFLEHNKYLIIKVKHGFSDQTEFAIPIYNYDSDSKGKNWLYGFYKVLPALETGWNDKIIYFYFMFNLLTIMGRENKATWTFYNHFSLFLEIFLRVEEPSSGANNKPNVAPTATPASKPKKTFPEIII